jgi:hypothetical protein
MPIAPSSRHTSCVLQDALLHSAILQPHAGKNSNSAAERDLARLLLPWQIYDALLCGTAVFTRRISGAAEDPYTGASYDATAHTNPYRR